MEADEVRMPRFKHFAVIIGAAILLASCGQKTGQLTLDEIFQRGTLNSTREWGEPIIYPANFADDDEQLYVVDGYTVVGSGGA